MDYIELPDNSHPHALVPDLGGPEFDNKGFQGYDKRQGWDYDWLQKHSIQRARKDWTGYLDTMEKMDYTPNGIVMSPGPDTPPGHRLVRTLVAQFCQTWILFGVLQEALNRPVFRHEVITIDTTTDGKEFRVLTLKRLFDEFEEKRDRIRSDSSWATRLSYSLTTAAAILSDMQNSWTHFWDKIFHLPVFLSLSIFTQTLNSYAHIFMDGNLIIRSYAHNDCQPLQTILIREHGYCPNMIYRLLETSGHAGLYYSSLVRKFREKQAHDQCTRDFCIASNIDLDNYDIRHSAELCSCCISSCDHKQIACPCHFIGIPESELLTAYGDNKFPLLRLQNDKLGVVEFKPGIEYVAISHVWSDGRGNPNNNELPICQLRSILQFVSGLTSNSKCLFWIDSICVPIRGPSRRDAIMRMARIYQSASYVLVLAEELLSRDLPSSPDECLFWIFSTKWMTRLWTMQEANLAKQLVFQFRDETISFRQLRHSLVVAFKYDKSHGHSRLVGLQMVLQMDTFSRGPLHESQDECSEEQKIDDELPLVRFWQALRHRHTSKPHDAAICGSILLGTDLGSVLAAMDGEKMQVFWSSQKRVPAAVLWANGPRLEHDGFKWAPCNLINPITSRSYIYPHTPPTQPTEHGLFVHGVEAIVLEKVMLPESISTRAIYRFSIPNSANKHFLYLDGKNGKKTWSDFTEFWYDRCVLLFPPAQYRDATFKAALILPNEEQKLNHSSSTEFGRIPAQYLTLVDIFREGEDLDFYLQDTIQHFDQRYLDLENGRIQFLDVASSRWMSPLQRWCIY